MSDPAPSATPAGEAAQPGAEPAAKTVPDGPRQPRRRTITRVVVLAGWAGWLILTFSPMVNAVGYLAGAGRAATFTVTGHSTTCYSSPTGSNCSTGDTGYLEPGDVAASWPGDDPAGVTFPVRLPTWNWGPGSPYLFNTGVALLVAIVFGSSQLGSLAVIGYWALRWIRPRLKG